MTNRIPAYLPEPVTRAQIARVCDAVFHASEGACEAVPDHAVEGGIRLVAWFGRRIGDYRAVRFITRNARPVPWPRVSQGLVGVDEMREWAKSKQQVLPKGHMTLSFVALPLDTATWSREDVESVLEALEIYAKAITDPTAVKNMFENHPGHG